MRRNRLVRVLRLLPIGIAAVAVLGLLVMSLWNWLMPALFGFKQIGFWQAWGLLILSRILFGGFGSSSHRDTHVRRRMRERLARMTPEERERFRDALRVRCGHFEPPPPKPAP
jgi:hypothetical protein